MWNWDTLKMIEKLGIRQEGRPDFLAGISGIAQRQDAK
jgi:hypothetical protein